MSGDSYEVAPLSRAKIRGVTRKLRRIACELGGHPEGEPYFDIYRFLDVVLPKHWEDFAVEILGLGEMRRQHGEAHALTVPTEQRILVREDIWERAEQRRGRDRLTLAHELGHLVLHANPTYSRKIADAAVPRFRQSEWQANAFAGELLVCADFIGRCRSAAEAARLFGVSDAAAETQWRAFERDDLI